ncbi:MAG: hypothetical protein ACPGU6_04610 [Tenacibaculum sp.]
MKNIYIYYIAIFAPIIAIVWGSKTEILAPDYFVAAFLLYVLVYRTFIDGRRLVAKKSIVKKDIWKLIIPGKRFEYLKELYLK